MLKMWKLFQISKTVSNGNRFQPISNQLLLRHKQKYQRDCAHPDLKQRRLTDFEVMYVKWSQPTCFTLAKCYCNVKHFYFHPHLLRFCFFLLQQRTSKYDSSACNHLFVYLHLHLRRKRMTWHAFFLHWLEYLPYLVNKTRLSWMLCRSLSLYSL